MKTEEKEEKIRETIDLMAEDESFIEIVKAVEGLPETTKGHYGEYKAFLTAFNSKITAINMSIIAPALKRAGANPFGVDQAVKLITG